MRSGVPLLFSTLVLAVGMSPCRAEWRVVYAESFDGIASGSRTGAGPLANWETGSAAGVVFDGRTKKAVRFLVAANTWTSFNQGPVLNLDLSDVPHDRVRVRCDLYTFGDWRGLQRATGGPQHRLMFFDGKAKPAFAFDTNFSTNVAFEQSWPDRSPKGNRPLTGATAVKIDATGRFRNAHRWPLEFDYPSRSPALRFTFLCGAAAGSGTPMPAFGIDNVRVEVHVPSESDPIPGTERHAAIRFELDRPTRVSLGVYERGTGLQVTELLRAERDAVRSAGKHVVRWDGLDRDGRPVPAGDYEWRLLETNGFAARFVCPLGVNPPSGLSGKFNHSWVGDHLGPGTVAVDESGVYLGARITEGLRQTLKQSHDATTRLWEQPQYYDGGRLTRMASNGTHVFLVQPNGRVRRLDARTGRLQRTWEAKWDDEPPSDVDCAGDSVVVCYPEHDTIRWIDPTNGSTRHENRSTKRPTNLTVRSNGEVVAVTEAGIVSLARPNAEPVVRVPATGHVFGAIDVDHATGELYVVDSANGERVLRYDDDRLVRAYGGEVRGFGRYDPTRFSGIGDVAADGRGGFYVVEPSFPPRRVAHFDATSGKLLREWYGGQSFYVDTAIDRTDPSNVWGCAGEGFVHHYVVNYDTGSWTIRAIYATGRLGDSLFPFAGKWRPVRRGEETWLVHESVPAVVRVDEANGRVVPVALASVGHNGGRRAIQFPGTGRDGFPKPWVAAAAHHGFDDPKQAPRHFYWGDTDGDGEFDPGEFRFFENARHAPNLISAAHVDVDFGYTIPAGGYGGSWFRLPRIGWTGPKGRIPVWAWDRVEPGGNVPAVVSDSSAVRGLARDDDGNVYGAVQSGIMIKGHGQFEGGVWPATGIRRARLVKWDADGRVSFVAGRHSKDSGEVGGGRFYFPQRTILGPADTLVVSDQLFQPATVWTRDGLYAGSLLDRPADDRPEAFYRPWSDDMQGVEVVQLDDGRVFWFMPYQGMNFVYEVTGWDELRRQRGIVRRPDEVVAAKRAGTGLRARYSVGGKVVTERIETPVYFDRFGPEREAPAAPYHVEWSGFLEPVHTGPHRFVAFLGKNERVRVAIGDDVVFTAGEKENVDAHVPLVAGRRYLLRIEYDNPDGRAELKLLWQSPRHERERLPIGALSPTE